MRRLVPVAYTASTVLRHVDHLACGHEHSRSRPAVVVGGERVLEEPPGENFVPFVDCAECPDPPVPPPPTFDAIRDILARR